MSTRKAHAELMSYGFGSDTKWYVGVKAANGRWYATHWVSDKNTWSALDMARIPKFLSSTIDELWKEANEKNKEFEAYLEEVRAQREREEAERKPYHDLAGCIYMIVAEMLDPNNEFSDIIPASATPDLLASFVNELMYSVEKWRKEWEAVAAEKATVEVYTTLLSDLDDDSLLSDDERKTIEDYVSRKLTDEFSGILDVIRGRRAEREKELLARWRQAAT